MLDKSIKDIPIEDIYKHPVVQSLVNQIDSKDLEKDVKLPYVIKDKILMSPGIWNGYYYSPDAIKEAFTNTEWKNKEIRSLFLDHLDGTDGRMGSLSWVGEIQNPKLVNDTVVGDLVLVDKPTAIKLHYGAKMGISPKVHGGEENGNMQKFLFDNFSVVINPAVKTAYINNSQKEVNKMSEIQEEVIDVLLNEEIVKNANVGDVAKKAKEIIKDNPDMKWSEAIKKAAAEMKEVKEEVKKEEKVAEVKNEEVIPEPEKPAEEQPVEPKKPAEEIMSDEQILEKAVAILKKKYPNPQEVPVKEIPAESKMEEEMTKKVTEIEVKMSEQIKTKDEIIQELSRRIESVEAKLNEPDKVSVKSEELSQSTMDVDEAFLGLLRSV